MPHDLFYGSKPADPTPISTLPFFLLLEICVELLVMELHGYWFFGIPCQGGSGIYFAGGSCLHSVGVPLEKAVPGLICWPEYLEAYPICSEKGKTYVALRSSIDRFRDVRLFFRTSSGVAQAGPPAD